MSGPCPSGHSAAFCAGWYVATHVQAVSPPAEQQQPGPPAQSVSTSNSSGGGMMTATATATAVVVTPADRGYIEGYSHWPMSLPHNKDYVEDYKMGVRDRASLKADSSLMFLGTLPAHSTDNYNDFYLGEHGGSDAYWAAQGHNTTAYYNCPSGHSAEFCAGWKFEWGIPSNFDAS
jgi:hypothetical protein